MIRQIKFSIVIWSIFFATFVLSASAQTFTGTVTDATTRKPAAGDEVVLIDFSGGMREVGHSHSDLKGNFSFTVPVSKQPRVLRVVHQGASYFKPAPATAGSIQVDVYDVSAKVKDIVVTTDITGFELKGKSLQAVRLFAVKNNSTPPLTQVSEHNFEFYLPEGAQIDRCIALSEGGRPVTTIAIPEKERDLYAFIFPLRPGETQFQVLYHMPYNGAVTVDPKPVYDVEHFGVMLPKKMHFAAVRGAAFQTMMDPRQTDTVLHMISHATAGHAVTFTLSDASGISTAKPGQAEVSSPANAVTDGSSVRDATVVPPAADSAIAPRSSERSQWYILGALGLVVATGTISLARRSIKQRQNVAYSAIQRLRGIPATSRTLPTAGDGGKLALGNLKEQLFQLEVRRKKRRISQQEYEEAMAGLHQNLEEALRGTT